MSRSIYCDESGFTGNNLLNQDSPYFSYATVDVSSTKAEEFVLDLIRKYKIQNGELKFLKLHKNNRGRKAIYEVIKTFHESTKIAIHDKKFNLLCKFFEYTFEPSIANKSTIFYSLGFNKFISNSLFLCFESNGLKSEKIYKNIEKFLRLKDVSALEALREFDDPIVQYIFEFIYLTLDNYQPEVENLKDSIPGKWLLDLSDTSLQTLLSYWSQQHGQLSVFCDQSKPIYDNRKNYITMIGRENSLDARFEDCEISFGFNLANPIQFVASNKHHGIQIADVFAGTSAYILKEIKKGKYSSVPKDWIPLIHNSILPISSVLPDVERLKKYPKTTDLNFAILVFLVERASHGLPLLSGIEEFILDYGLKIQIPNFDKLCEICSDARDLHTEVAQFLVTPPQQSYERRGLLFDSLD